MTTLLNVPIRKANFDTLRDLQVEFPNAQLRIEIKSTKTASLLTEQGFWDIISGLDWSDANDNNRVLAPAVAMLAKAPVHHIYLFADILAEKLYNLDRKILAENIGQFAFSDNRPFSSDNFLYSRCCVIANGQAAYEAVLENPTLMPKDLTFEALLGLASKAYQLKTGKKLDYIPTISIETHANKTAWQFYLGYTLNQ